MLLIVTLQLVLYCKTWLHEHNLTIMEEVVDVDVLEDEVEITTLSHASNPAATGSKNSAVTGSTSVALRWNIPAAGNIFIEVIRNFITTMMRKLFKNIV